MSKDLKNKVVVITGGAEGIGFAVADNFLEKGAKLVVLLDINEVQGAEAVKDLTSKYGDNKVVFRKCDVTKDLEEVSNELIEKYENIDVLVNNAGIMDETSLRRTIELNTIAVIEWTMKFWEKMRTDKNGPGGTIVNTASVAGFETTPYTPFYQASKHAVMGFTKSLGHESNFKRYGVRIVAICPGFTKTTLGLGASLTVDVTVRDIVADLVKTVPCQMPAAVGKAAVEVFEKADSGTAWRIEDGAPLKQVDRIIDIYDEY